MPCCFPIYAVKKSGVVSYHVYRLSWAIKINRTRIHLILFSPLAVGDGQGWQNPISCDDIPAMENIVAREGSVKSTSNC